jgi:hypothetical protein
MCAVAFTLTRLANTPLETAYELRVVASMTQLLQLELGVIFDGSSSQHDVPRALESLGDLQKLQVGHHTTLCWCTFEFWLIPVLGHHSSS